MRRGKVVVTVAAVIVGICAAAGVILIGTAVSDDAPDDPRPALRPGEHGASELRSPDIGDLPAAETATRAFMRDYLKLISGGGVQPETVANVSRELVAQLQREAARLPPTQEGRQLRIASVAVTFAESRQAATASVQVASPGRPTFVMTLRLEHAPGGGWQVVRLRA